MATKSPTSNHIIFSAKLLLKSTAIISIALLLKLSVSVILKFIVSQLPLLWSSLLSWLTPPYLYVVINGIIITIAASSRFQHKIDNDTESCVVPLKVPPPVDSRLDFSVSHGFQESVLVTTPVKVRSEVDFVTVRNEILEKKEYREEEKKTVSKVVERERDGFVISRSSWTPSRKDSTEIPFSPEKPLVSARFGHRKPLKPSPEAGKALRVAKPKRHDTLEGTWKTITDGRPIPLARHLKKSDTWETRGRHRHTAGVEERSSPKMKKSETFKERNENTALTPSPGSGKLKKEPSLSQDELNRRVEVFINKFKEEMRLERQESLNQYKEMRRSNPATQSDYVITR